MDDVVTSFSDSALDFCDCNVSSCPHRPNEKRKRAIPILFCEFSDQEELKPDLSIFGKGKWMEKRVV